MLIHLLSQTAKHLESYAANSPFAKVISPNSLTKAVVGTEVNDSASDDAPTDEAATDEKIKTEGIDEDAKAEGQKVDPDNESIGDEEVAEAKDTTERVKKVKFEATVANIPADAEAKADEVSFMAVHEFVYNRSENYHEQYNEYLIKYAEEWEHTVSTRVNGLLIHYRELHQRAEHYSTKVVGLIHKVDKTNNVRDALAEKLDRNEIKEMGAFEARDTVGESLYLLIDEITERAWKDVYPLLLRACRFEADVSASEASLLSQLNTVAAALCNSGNDNGCEITGRLQDLMHKHTEEIYTVENPFVKMTPTKNVEKQLLEEPHKSESDNVPNEAQDSNVEK